MSISFNYTLRDMMKAGVHFGHHPRRWNPKMKPYIFGARNNIHIIDLGQTFHLLSRALQAVHDTIAGGGRVLFVGTKKQASAMVAEHAKRCGQYYVNHRWLGGTLTNWKTISASIRRLKELEAKMDELFHSLTKKEALKLERHYNNLELFLGGIKEMGGRPDLLLVFDTLKDTIAVTEAKKLKIPIVAILDTNSDPEGILYPVPGNDDGARAIEFYCHMFADAALKGLQSQIAVMKSDRGSSETLAEDLKDPEGFVEFEDPKKHDDSLVSGIADPSRWEGGEIRPASSPEAASLFDSSGAGASPSDLAAEEFAVSEREPE